MAGCKCPPACGSVTSLCCPNEGKKGASYELCSNCAHSADAGQVQERKNECKFDLCYLMSKEGITFEKYVVLYELEACHDVDPGHAYKTAPSVKLFTHYIAKSQRQ